MHTLITSCSSTRTIVPRVRVGDLPTGLTMSSALDLWMNKLNAVPKNITPRELYRGLGFMTLTKIQEAFKPETVKIVTGGLGLTDMDEPICPYDFTASPKEPENIHKAVTAEPFVQTVWWRMINDVRGKGVAPVCELITNKKEGGYVIIACSKIFLRYISDDILSTPFEYRHRIRILLAASSQGSVPAQLRPMMIPFDREFVGDIPGNRNDNNHRAAYRFLELLEENPDFASSDIGRQRQYFMNIEGSTTHSIHYGAKKVDLREFLKERPHYLTMTWEQAYKLTRRELGTIGGKMYFRGVFRSLQPGGSRIGFIALGDGERLKALEALNGLGLINSNSGENTGETTSQEEETILKDISIFLEVIKNHAPKAIFSTVDVCKWAQKYQGDKVLEAFKSPNKLAYIIKANTAVLGIKESGNGYSLREGTPPQL